MRYIKLYFLFIFLTILAACSNNIERPSNITYIDKNDPEWQQHLQQLKKIQTYSANGQFGYISPKERFSSRFQWHYQNPHAYQLKLYSTLSSSSLTIEMRPQGLLIADNKGRQRSSSDAHQLMREIVGVEFPLDKFAQWLKGQPDEQGDYQVGQNHLLASFNYPFNGKLWSADYLNYAQSMPQDIVLKTEAQTLKIRIDNWTF